MNPSLAQHRTFGQHLQANANTNAMNASARRSPVQQHQPQAPLHWTGQMCNAAGMGSVSMDGMDNSQSPQITADGFFKGAMGMGMERLMGYGGKGG